MTLTPTLEPGGLVSDTLALDAGIIYTATSPVMIKDLVFINTNATPQVVLLYETKAGGSRALRSTATLQQNWRQVLPEKGQTFCLGVGDILEAITTTASAVTWSMSDLVTS